MDSFQKESVYEIRPYQFWNDPEGVGYFERTSILTVDENGVLSYGDQNVRRLNEHLVKTGIRTENERISTTQPVNIVKYEASIFEVLVALSHRLGKLEKLSEVVDNSRMVAARGAMADLGARKHNPTTPLKLLFGVYKGIVFMVSENKDRPRDNTGFINECALTVPSVNAPNFLTHPAPWHESYVQGKLELGLDKPKKVTVFINGQLDCLDSEGRQVELKLKKYGLDNSYLPHTDSSRWFLQQVLVGTEWIVVSEHSKDSSWINSVSAIHIEQLENGLYGSPGNRMKNVPHWNRKELIAHMKFFLNGMKHRMLNDVRFKDKIVVVEKVAEDTRFFITKVLSDRSAMFPPHFTDHFDRVG
ncbi:hypothetical protein L596_022710 [Steinernema carpocapsae]|uniref:Decapping nuclease n=1 Tax=Steinernema carpocapsae TaxID=34508 RepID=A0A4U5MNS8_STECR|nr:hypothetical protein L596_022710 [Steinernema carpocapsae]